MLQTPFFPQVLRSKQPSLGFMLFFHHVLPGSLGLAVVGGDISSPASAGFIPGLVLLLLGHRGPWQYQDQPRQRWIEVSHGWGMLCWPIMVWAHPQWGFPPPSTSPQLISHPPNPTKERRSDTEGRPVAVGRGESTDPSARQARKPNNPIPTAALTRLRENRREQRQGGTSGRESRRKELPKQRHPTLLPGGLCRGFLPPGSLMSEGARFP